MKPKIIFFGSDEYSLIVLNQLIGDKRFKIVSVVTTSPSPVEDYAQILFKIKFTVCKKGKPFDKKFFDQMRKLKLDVGILASFGKIFPKESLMIPKHGILNIHPSLLPKYRGPTPGQAAILNDDKETGVTIIKMDEKIDHGRIVSQFKEEIKPDDTSQSLYDRLFSAGAEVLKTILPAYLEGRIELHEQDHQRATYTKKLTREDGFIPPEILEVAMSGRKVQRYKVFRQKLKHLGGQAKFQSKTVLKNSATLPLCHSATYLERFIRAMHPWPGAWCSVKTSFPEEVRPPGEVGSLKRLKILGAHLEKGKLVLDEVQLEGKKPVSWKQFQEGYPGAKLVS